MAYIYGTLSYAKDSNGTTIAYNGTNVYQIRLGYQVNSQDIELNKSNITLQLEVRSINSQYRTYGYNQTTTIDGTTLSAKNFDFRTTNAWQVFGTKTLDITHNADGTYSANKSASFTTTASGAGRPKTGSASVTLNLPTIPRASQITVNDANIGSATNIVINKASASFTTTLWYKASDENSWTKIVDKTSNQVYGWTVPTSFYSKIPSTRTLTCSFKADTYSGDTLIGTSNEVTATFTATGNPYFYNIQILDVNSTTIALTGDNTKMIKYASNVEVYVDATGINDSSIASITVNGNTISLTGSARKSGSIVLNASPTNVMTIVATDTRGYTTTEVHTLTMVNYVPLSINANVKRNQPTDGRININLSGNYFNDTFGSQSNTLVVQYRYKEYGASSWEQGWTTGNVSPTINSNNTYSYSKGLTNMDYTKAYTFEVKAYDKIGTQTIIGITVTKGQPIFNWNNDEFDVNVFTNLKEDVIVKSIATKNIFNMNGNINIRANNGNTETLNSISNNILTCNVNGWQEHAVGQKFTDLNGKTITFSAKLISKGTGDGGGIAIYSNNALVTTSTVNNLNEYVIITYTCNSDNVVCGFFTTGGGIGAQYTDIQVEIGNSRTDYSPYQDLNYQEIYSTSEIKIGTWVDGKTLYRKVVLGTLVDGDLAVDLTSLNIYELIKVDGFCGNQRPLNFYYSGFSVSTRFSGGYMYIFASSPYANNNFKMIIEYTKNS